MTKQGLALLMALLLPICSCVQEEKNSIAGMFVCFDVDLNSWDKELKSDNSYKIFTSESVKGRPLPSCGAFGFGLGGIIVIKALDEGQGASFQALDLACPYEAKGNIRVQVYEKENKLVCDKCKSEFELIGTPGRLLRGPSKYNMKRYVVQKLTEDRFSVMNLNR